MALVFPARADAIDVARAVAGADGRLVRFGATRNVVIANFGGLDVATILARTGALAALDPKVPGSCLAGWPTTQGGDT